MDDIVVVRVGEERFELQVHGGVAVVEGVLDVCWRAGVRGLFRREMRRDGIF